MLCDVSACSARVVQIARPRQKRPQPNERPDISPGPRKTQHLSIAENGHFKQAATRPARSIAGTIVIIKSGPLCTASRREDTRIAQDKAQCRPGTAFQERFAPRRGRGEDLNHRSCSCNPSPRGRRRNLADAPQHRPNSIPGVPVGCKKALSPKTTLDVGQAESMPETGRSQDSQFEEAIALHGAALERLARAYEADPETRRDLLQEIHIALWKSLDRFDN